MQCQMISEPMNINKISLREEFKELPNVQKKVDNYNDLVEELNTRELPNTVIEKINDITDRINNSPIKNLGTFIGSHLNKIQTILIKEAKLIPQNYYKNLWSIFGFTAFGIPIGMVLSHYKDNTALLGIGLPIGLLIGSFLGSHLDKKTQKEGRQLNWKSVR